MTHSFVQRWVSLKVKEVKSQGPSFVWPLPTPWGAPSNVFTWSHLFVKLAKVAF